MGQSSQTRPECFSSTFAEILFVLAATMSCAMTSWLGGGLTVVTAKIGDSLHMDNAQITWATAASSLTTGAFLLFFGRLADLFGRKQMMVVSLFLYAVFCLAAGFVKDGITFDIIQGLLGFCSAASIPAAVGALGSVYSRPSKRKNYAFACFSAGNPVGFVCGTFACGVATTILSWRAYFFFLAIVYLFFSVAAFFVVPRDTDEKQPWTWQTFKNFDIGALPLLPSCRVAFPE